jgi:ankyrin repeat protein
MSSLEDFAEAIERGNSPIVESFISRDLVDVNVRLPRQDRPPALVQAARFGRKDVVDILLRANARVDETDERGWTACHVAALYNHRDVLELLLAHQPNVDVTDVGGKTAFFFAVRLSDEDASSCALMLLEAGASLEQEHPADLCRFAATSTATIQALIDRGVNVRELRISDDSTPLHVAARGCRDAGVFNMLVNVCGIDLETRDRCGQTCLGSAAAWGNVVALRCLLNAGAEVNVAEKGGETPLHWAYKHDCAVMLIAAGANVCSRDNIGRTALHRVMLAWNGLTAVHSLLAAGADLNATDNAGETARQALARHGWTIEPDQIEVARKDIARTRIDFIRCRALEVCISFQSLRFNALQMCEILVFACGPVAQLVPFHIWWTIATTVKHFQSK